MATIAVTARSAAEVVSVARLLAGPESLCVAWGPEGVSTPEAFDVLPSTTSDAAEVLRGVVRFAQGRCAGHAGSRVLWGTQRDVVAALEAGR